MSSSGTSSIYWPLNCGFLHHVNKSLLNILCIIHPFRSSSWNTLWSISFEILKDLYLFWSGFFEGLFKWIFSYSSHMLSPVFSHCEFYFFLSDHLFINSFAISIDFIASSQLLCSLIRNSSSFGNYICTVRFSFHWCLPKLSSNEVCSITTCLLLLY